ncbi:MAG: hypothetical protein ACYC1W_13650 [Gemmatimonadaceae bacterium]
MKTRFVVSLAPAFVLLVSCSGTSKSAATPATDSAAVDSAAAAAATDSIAKAAGDSLAKLVGDSATKKAMATPVPAKTETGDYDKANRPRFNIDEKTGKIDTNKRP